MQYFWKAPYTFFKRALYLYCGALNKARKEPFHATLKRAPPYTRHCNTLQHTATLCNTLEQILQHIATHCNTLQHFVTLCDTLQQILQHTATDTATRLISCKKSRSMKHSESTALHNTLQQAVTQCNTLQHTAATLQHTATYCNTLQHIATHCNKL